MSAHQSNLPEFSVSELSSLVKKQIEEGFSYVRVRGELGRISRPNSGHVYLDLKDDRAVLASVIWKGVATGLKVKLEEGLEVVATGKLTTFPGQSKYQMVIESLAPAGVGALMALLEERKKKLALEGLFDEARKKPIPFLPNHIGVVTSPSGAVIRDILHRLSDRFPRHVTVWPVRVQGETSAEEVARAIDGFNAADGRVIARPDLIIVARGGGSLEDLWGFNEEIVVRAAANSAIPLISAVGHETDWTLIDLAADWRAPTPTAAAERAVPVRLELMQTVSGLGGRLEGSAVRAITERAERVRALARALPRVDALFALPCQRLDAVSGRLGAGFSASISRAQLSLVKTSQRLKPSLLLIATERLKTRWQEAQRRLIAGFTANRLAKAARLSAIRFHPSLIAAPAREGRGRLDHITGRASLAMSVNLRQKGEQLARSGALLQSLGPQRVLSRGYALVRSETGDVLTRKEGLLAGQGVRLQFADGDVGATIDGGASTPKAEKAAKPAPKTAPEKVAKSAEMAKKQTDLFE